MSGHRAGRAAIAAASAAVLGAAVAVRLSTPNLCRPLGAALLVHLLAPAAGAVILLALLRLWPGRAGRGRGSVLAAAIVAPIPWWWVASAEVARSAAWVLVGLLLAAAGALLFARRRGWWLAGLIGALALLMWPQARIQLRGERSAVMLGFDGATWTEIQPLVEAGEMPVLAGLREQAAVGVLQSDPYTLSPRVWTSIATGVDPEVHGIIAFGLKRDALRAGRIWDEVVHQGGSAGVMGWLINWPPDATLDFSLPGWLAAGTESLPQAAAFLPQLDQVLGTRGPRKPASVRTLLALGRNALAVSRADHVLQWLPHMVWLATERPPPFVQRPVLALLMAKLEADLFVEYLARYRPQFGALVTYPTDALGHNYWKYHEADLFPDLQAEEIERFGSVVADTYRCLDRTVGQVLERLDLSRTTVMMVSDHGMKVSPLEDRQLVIRGSLLLDLLGLEEQLNAFNVVQMVVLAARQDAPDGPGSLQQAYQALAAARLEPSGRRAFKVSDNPRQSTVSLKMQARGLGGGEQVVCNGRSIALEELCTPEFRSGDHTREGVILLAGPGVQPGRIQAVLQDAAATALYAMDLAVPEALEGEVITAGYREDWLETHPVRTRAGAMALPATREAETSGDEDVEDRLRDLGYVR